MFCANNLDRLVKTAELSDVCNCSPHHTAHVVQQLQASGDIVTVRGRAGGIRLARPTDQISIGAVVRRFESDIPLAECFDAVRNTCPLVSACRLRGYLARAHEAFFHELDLVTLDDLVRGNCGLSELLTLQPAAPVACKP